MGSRQVIPLVTGREPWEMGQCHRERSVCMGGKRFLYHLPGPNAWGRAPYNAIKGDIQSGGMPALKAIPSRLIVEPSFPIAPPCPRWAAGPGE